ncbi:hypothetical protein MTO96_028213 [Rhipicephalus appendiculatus]
MKISVNNDLGATPDDTDGDKPMDTDISEASNSSLSAKRVHVDTGEATSNPDSEGQPSKGHGEDVAPRSRGKSVSSSRWVRWVERFKARRSNSPESVWSYCEATEPLVKHNGPREPLMPEHMSSPGGHMCLKTCDCVRCHPRNSFSGRESLSPATPSWGDRRKKRRIEFKCTSRAQARTVTLKAAVGRTSTPHRSPAFASRGVAVTPLPMDPAARCVVETVDVNAKLLNDVQASIWRVPEVRFEEKRAHDLLTEELHKAGFQITPNYVLPTAFRAEYSKPGVSAPCVCFMAEYDALSETGHCCGHNLIAEAALGASMALKKALETTADLSGRVICLGTPAGEGGSSKLLMAKGDALADADAVIMAHPSSVNDVAPPYLAVGKVRARYIARALSMACAPSNPVNALDAAVTAYSAVNAMRQHIKPTWKVNGVITSAGSVANVIPDETELLYSYRAPNALELEQLRRLLDNCLQGAAVSTGCNLDMDWEGGYEALLTNEPLADAFRKSAASLGLQLQPKSSEKLVFLSSSDMGHVSQRAPTIQPTFAVCSAPSHSREFAAAVCYKEAQAPTLLMAKAMALTGLELIRDPELLKEVRKNFFEGLAQSSTLL